MAINLPTKSYLTLQELVLRWKCTENDLKDLIVRGLLKPSYFIQHVAEKVRFRIESDDSGTYWLPESTATREDDEGIQRNKLYDTSGPYYLLHPNVVSALDCNFFLFSQDRDHVKGPNDENICFMLTGRGKWEHGITLEMVLKNGMVMLSEIARFEEQPPETPSVEKILNTKERNSLLVCIAVLCNIARYDLSKTAKTAGLIVNAAAGMGVSIGETTIEEQLKKASSALASRMK